MAKFISKCTPFAACVIFVVFACASFAQSTYTITGRVLGEDEKPLEGAVIRIERKDMKWETKLKTNKRGEYTHAGIPVGGTYKVTCEVGGKDIDFMDNAKPRLGEPLVVNFDLAARKRVAEAQRLAIESGGTISPEQARQLTAEQRAEIERTLKEKSADIAKNKALNDAFNAGMEAEKAGQFQAAVDAFSKASEIDPKQDVVYGHLADAYVGLGGQKTGADQEAAYAKATEAYQKAIELKPAESGYVNNFGTALVRMKKLPEAQAAFEKAAQMDPSNAAKYYYNLGAVLMNTGQTENAGDAFKKAIAANPKYAIAQYQYGIYLVGKAQISADGKITPPEGTREAFQTYLELDPSGPFAQAAKDMLASFDTSIETQYLSPAAKKKAEDAAKKKQQQKKN